MHRGPRRDRGRSGKGQLGAKIDVAARDDGDFLGLQRLGLGAEGATSGAAAAATGGVSVLVQGFLDRARGGQDLCKKTLEVAAAKAK